LDFSDIGSRLSLMAGLNLNPFLIVTNAFGRFFYADVAGNVVIPDFYKESHTFSRQCKIIRIDLSN